MNKSDNTKSYSTKSYGTKSYATKRLVPAAIGCALLAASPYGAAQKVEQGVAIVSETIASRVDGFSYSPDSTSKLDFAGTSLGLGAAGEASVKISHGKTEISGKFQKLPEPSSLGP